MNESFPNQSPSESSVIEGESEEISEDLPSYLELKRDYKEKQRLYKEALAADIESRSAVKKMFGVGRKDLSPETQALYDESLVAEKAYYKSFLETQKDKVEARINRGNFFEDEKQSIVPALLRRHIINPAEARLNAQRRELPPLAQSVLNKIKANKYALGTASAVGLGMKGVSILSSFGVGIAAGAGSKWLFNKAKEFDKNRLEKKALQFQELFESGELEDLGDIKNEYFQDLRRIDNAELAANLTVAGVAVTAGSSFHGSELQADTGDFVSEKFGEYIDTAKEKISGWFDTEDGDPKPTQNVESVNDLPGPIYPIERPESVGDLATESQSEEDTSNVETPLGEAVDESDDDLVSEPATSNETAAPELEDAELQAQAQAKVDALNELESIKEEAEKLTIDLAESEVIKPEVASFVEEITAEKYTVESGDNIWNILETNLESNGLFEGLEEGQKLHLLDELKDKVEAMSPEELKEFGVSSGNAQLLHVGDELDFSQLINEDSVSSAVEHAQNLSESEISSIETNTLEADVPHGDGEVVSPPTTEDTGLTPAERQENSPNIHVVNYEHLPNEPQSEVPDYTGNTNEVGEVISDTNEQTEMDTEKISNIPREVSQAEVLEKQRQAASLFDMFDGDDPNDWPRGILNPQFLAERDAYAGYEPLYTSELLNRTIEVDPSTSAVDTQRKLGEMVALDMLEAYKAGQIDLPLQWVYMLDVLGDTLPEPNSVLDGSTDWNKKELLELSSNATSDLKGLNSLSSENIKALGISSGTFENIRPGDTIKTGEIIKLMMENMAERINPHWKIES